MRFFSLGSSKLLLYTFLMPLLVSGFLTWCGWGLSSGTIETLQEGWWWFFPLAVLLMGTALFPTTFTAILVGFLWSFEGMGAMVIAYQAAALLGFFLGKGLAGEWLRAWAKANPKKVQFTERLRHKPLLLVVVSRLSPALPFSVNNLLMAGLGIPWKTFFWGGLLGMLPRTLVAVWIGASAADLKNAVEGQGEWQPLLLALGLLAVLTKGGILWQAWQKSVQKKPTSE